MSPELFLGLVLAAGLGACGGAWIRARRSREEVTQVERRWSRTNRTLAQERDRLRIALDELTLDRARLERHADERGVRLREMEAERDSAESINATAQATLAMLRERVEIAEASRGAQRRELDTLQREIGHKSMAVETLQTELAVAQEVRARRDVELQAARNQNVRLEGEVRRRDEQLVALQSEWDRIREERDALDGELLSARDEPRPARHSADAAARMRELERVLAIERNQSAVLREELREQSQQVALLEDGRRLDARRSLRIEELEEQIDQLDRDAERVRGELTALRSVHRFKEEEARALAARVQALEAELRASGAGLTVEPVVLPLDGRPRWVLAKPDGEADDLQEIRGVGPALERSMNALGIYHFRQIAAWAPADVEWTTTQIESIRGRVERDEWIDQAIELHQKKYGSRP